MANEYKVKVGVDFSAHMNQVDSAVDALGKKLKGLGSLTGNKELFGGLKEEFESITAELNKLRDVEITPRNADQFSAKVLELGQRLDALNQKTNQVSVDVFDEKLSGAAQKIDETNTRIDSLKNEIQELSSIKSPTEAEKQRLESLNVELEKTEKTLKGQEAYRTRLQNASRDLGITEDQLREALELLAVAHGKVADASEDQRRGEEELKRTNLAETIQNQVNRYIGLNAIYRYSKKYIQDLVKTYKEFDQSLVAIAAVTGQTRDQMWANIGVYNKMAQSLGTTTQEVINASKLYYQQGLTTTSVLKLTEETVKLATIAELDSADATEYLTTAMNGFKLSAEESTRVTDVWANLAAKTASDVDELAVAISKVASLAENAGMEIETASAFLNQMIETTREAPENLGTALKTIIARFQELKVSEEALSDGVDANKVERALKSAGVALRGLDGQFRDFDDVILDLSSKWDTLDRNTQRYIATIAAGSRQQSRFIAMVSDYEGLLRNVNYAYDSLGSADAQMAVFQEGLTASTNRLQAAWEGLYTSWSESATVISKLIDAAASFVSTLADIGAGTSAVIAAFALLTVTIATNAATMEIRNVASAGQIAANIKNASSLAIEAAATEAERVALKDATKAMLQYTGAAAASTGQNIALAASQALVVAKYVVVLAILAAVLYAIIKIRNQQKEHIKELEKEAEASRQAAAQTKDRASSLGVLATELKEVHDAGEDETEVRQKIIDQYGTEIGTIDVLIGKYKQLLAALEEEQRQENILASAQYFDTWSKEAELAAARAVDSIESFETGKMTKVYSRDSGGTAIVDEVPEVKYRVNGKVFDSLPEAEEYAIQSSQGTFNASYAKFIGDTIASDELFDSTKIDISGLAQAMLQSGKKISDIYDDIEYTTDDKGNKIIASVGGFSKDFIQEINNLSNEFEKDSSLFNSLIAGSFENLTLKDTTNLLSKFDEDSSLREYLQNQIDSLTTVIHDGFVNSNLSSVIEGIITNNLSLGAQKAFIDTFNSLGDDPAAQEAYKNNVIKLISNSTNPEEINSAIIESLGDPEEAFSAYAAMLDGLGEMKEGVDPASFNALRDALEGLDSAFAEGKATVDAYYSSMQDLADLQKGDLSNEDYLAKLYSEAAALAEVTGADYNLVVAEMLKATTLNESGQMILQQTDLLKQWTDEQYISSAQTVEAKKAELLAYSASMEAIATELYALADEAEARELSTKGAVDNSDLVAKAANLLGQAEDEMGAAGKQAWSYVQGGKYTGAYQAVTKEAKDLSAQLKKLGNTATASDIRALANEAHARALTAASQAAQLSINKLANSFDKAGKSAGGAAKETDKLKDALKDLQDQLKDTKDDAERAIDAVTDYLEEQKKAAEDAIKAAEDALEKERNILKIQLEAYKEYLEQRQKENQDALELQAQAAAEYFKTEIEGIQARIDALDDEAEAEDRILKLQKARDEYNRAQNSRTRLVLTKGAGWIFKSDQKEIADARKTLNDVQREIQKAAYQDQIDELQKQADEWERIAENITKTAEEIARLTEAVEKFRQGVANGGTGYADINAFRDATEAQTVENGNIARILEKIEKWLEQVDWEYQDYLDDQMRQGFTEEFAKGLVGEKDLEEKVSGYLKNLLSTQQFIEEQQKIIANIENVQAFYELQKSQLELTKAQLEEAKKMRAAIEKAYDPTSENLGLGENSKYYNANILNLIESVHALVEQIAVMEAKQAAQGSGGNSGSGGNGNSSDGSGNNSDSSNGGWSGRGNSSRGSQLPGQEESNGPCNHDWVKDHSNGHFTYYRCRKCGTMISVPYGVNPSGTGYENPFGTPGFGGYGGVGGKSGKLPIISPIGSQNGIGLPSMSTLSTSTPSFNKVTNTSSTTTINIGTLESSANDYNGFVNDLMRNSMIKQPI